MALDQRDLGGPRSAYDEGKLVPGAGDNNAPPDADARDIHVGLEKLRQQRKWTFGIGLLKGMAVTLKHLFKHNTVIEYQDEKQDLSPRTRGVIALKEENCTVCMLCGRECPDWCIYIDSHKETLPPKRAGGRPRKRNVLDRFAIDYALCMYCGICVEVCPYDALFWSREFEYAELDIRELTHEKERLSDWMATVLPPPELEVGAELPGQESAAGTAAVAAGGAGPGSAQRPSPPSAGTATAERPEQAQRQPAAAATAAPPAEKATPSQEQAGETKETQPEGRAQATEEKTDVSPAEVAEEKGPDTVQPEAITSPTEAKGPEPAGQAAPLEQERPSTADGAGPADAAPSGAGADARRRSDAASTTPAPAAGAPTGAGAVVEESPLPEGAQVVVPAEAPRPVALEKTEDPQAVFDQVLQEQLDKGSSRQVAEARAKVARVKAERGIKRGPTPVHVEKPVPSAPTKGQEAPPEPSGAPRAEEPKPEQGPVAPTDEEKS